ncbi:MAG: suppressor of fused domain protein, partial [Clostridiaceae bacterium]|nr:suppressor of fused domain protein [Clostridiaceae bacterium]
NFYSVLPVYKEEMNFKLDNSAEDLIVKFKDNNINEILNLDRINVCERRKRFLFF